MFLMLVPILLPIFWKGDSVTPLPLIGSSLLGLFWLTFGVLACSCCRGAGYDITLL
jgi:hypothetical protein